MGSEMCIRDRFAAMVTVLGLVSISTGNLKITVEALPVFLGALLLGPVDGLAIGGVGTLLYQLLRFGVSATTALWIAPYVLLGLCVGAVSARHGYACTPRQLALLAVLGELGITVLNTGSLYIDSLIYGYYSPVFVFGTLPVRLAICDMVLPADKRVPLILDDALVTFDDERLHAALDYLLEESQRRQILLFTCQKRETAYLQGKENVTVTKL